MDSEQTKKHDELFTTDETSIIDKLLEGDESSTDNETLVTNKIRTLEELLEDDDELSTTSKQNVTDKLLATAEVVESVETVEVVEPVETVVVEPVEIVVTDELTEHSGIVVTDEIMALFVESNEQSNPAVTNELSDGFSESKGHEEFVTMNETLVESTQSVESNEVFRSKFSSLLSELTVNDILNYYYFVRRYNDLQLLNNKIDSLLVYVGSVRVTDINYNCLQDYVLTLLKELSNEDIKHIVEVLLNYEILKKDEQDNKVNHVHAIEVIKKVANKLKGKVGENVNYVDEICKIIYELLHKQPQNPKNVGLLQKSFTVMALPFTFAVGTILGGFCLAGMSIKSLLKKK